MFASLHTSTMTVRHVQSRGNLGSVLASLLHVYNVYNQRQKLAALGDAALADIGLTRAEAVAEANRPLWDIPAFARH